MSSTLDGDPRSDCAPLPLAQSATPADTVNKSCLKHLMPANNAPTVPLISRGVPVLSRIGAGDIALAELDDRLAAPKLRRPRDAHLVTHRLQLRDHTVRDHRF